MILSMTGYGKAATGSKETKFTTEIKSLNSKQLDLSIRIPLQFREFELPLRSLIAKKLERGKIDVIINVESVCNETLTTINQAAVANYKAQIEELAQSQAIPFPEDWFSILLKLPDVLKTETKEADEEETGLLRKAMEEALDKLIEFRTQEGNRLETFFKEKINEIQRLLNEVPQYETERITKIKKRISDALEKLGDVDYDKNRFEQEMIFYIEKLDITEEKSDCKTTSTTFFPLWKKE